MKLPVFPSVAGGRSRSVQAPKPPILSEDAYAQDRSLAAALVVAFYSGEILAESDLTSEIAKYWRRAESKAPTRRALAKRLLVRLGPSGREVADAIEAEIRAKEKKGKGGGASVSF
jgi:hypothetical protein